MSPGSGVMGGIGWRRLAAWVADTVVIAVIGIALMLPFGWHLGMHYDAMQRLVSAVGGAVLFGFYVVPFLVRDGTTPGKRVAGLRVVMAEGGGVPSLRVAVLRDPVLKVLVLGSLLDVIHPLLGFVTLAVDVAPVFWGGEGRTLHDRIAGTIVVDAR